MYREIRFFGLIFFVIIANNVLKLRSDFAYYKIDKESGVYTYLSPRRDRMNQVVIPINTKPIQLENYSDWLFYMFGLRTDKVLFGKVDCLSVYNCVSNFGLLNGIRIWRFESEHGVTSYPNVNSLSGVVVRRDLSDADVLEKSFDLEIINSTEINGLALRLSKLFERQGYNVVELNSEVDDTDFVCRLRVSREIYKYMRKLPLGECEITILDDKYIGTSRLELGKRASLVIQYLLYGRSFKMGEY